MTDTAYRSLTLSGAAYLRRVPVATLADDGHVDEIAVSEFVGGRDVALTPREAVCVVYELNRRMRCDSQIAERIGISTNGVQKIRHRHGIEPIPEWAEPTYERDMAC